jgi:hypothetical protein
MDRISENFRELIDIAKIGALFIILLFAVLACSRNKTDTRQVIDEWREKK